MEQNTQPLLQQVREDKIVEVSSTPQITTIRELRPTSHSKVLEARVYRKWTSVTYAKKNQSGISGKKKETAYCCILIDREGNAIQANMNVNEIDYFSPKIKLGLVYRFSDFGCEPTNPYQQTISNRTSLRFGRATKFDPIEAPEIPHHYFEFASYNQLQHRVPREDATGRMQYPILTDYMGCLRSPGEVAQKTDANQNESVFRKVDIENLSGNVVEFTMWDDMAKTFEDADFETMQKPIIIAVSSCRVTKFRDYQLTATSATQYYLNPQIQEADEARARYKEKHQKTPPLNIIKTPYQDIEKEKFRNRFPLKTLLKQEPDSYTGVMFTSEATITSINIKRDWYYICCNQCASKVKEEDGMYRCLNHGKQEKPSYRYIFKGFITDGSATVPITFFSPAADDITGYSCPELLANHTAKDPQEIPLEIFAIEGEKNIFQFHFNTSSRTTDFNLDRVFNKKNTQQGTSQLLETASGVLPATLALANQERIEEKEDEQDGSKTTNNAFFQHQQISETPPSPLALTTDESAEEKKKAKAGSETPENPFLQDQATSATPPPALTFIHQEASKTAMQAVMQDNPSQESKAKTVKRALFQEELPGSKKQKAAAEATTAEKAPTRTAEKKKQN